MFKKLKDILFGSKVPAAPEAIIFESEEIKKTVKKSSAPKTAKKPVKKAPSKKSK